MSSEALVERQLLLCFCLRQATRLVEELFLSPSDPGLSVASLLGEESVVDNPSASPE